MKIMPFSKDNHRQVAVEIGFSFSLDSMLNNSGRRMCCLFVGRKN